MKAWFIIIVIAILWSLNAIASQDSIHLFPGYVTRMPCEGKLLVSAVGNEALVRLEPLPHELGCGVLLKPVGASGRTNLILETSTGTIQRVLEVSAGSKAPSVQDLNHPVSGDLR